MDGGFYRPDALPATQHVKDKWAILHTGGVLIPLSRP